MEDRYLWASGHGVAILVGLAIFAFVSGHWGILIALAPAAYLLVLYPGKSENAPKVVTVSHLVAVVVGWVAYTTLIRGISPTSIEPMSTPGLRLVGSVMVAFVGCTAIFYALQLPHPTAYVTAFTATIGAFPTPHSLAVVALAILFVAGLQAGRRRFGPDTEVTTGVSASDLSGPSNRP